MRTEKLHEHILREFFGDIVAEVGRYLLKHTFGSLKEIIKHTGLPQAKAQEALLILIQHGMVEFELSKSGFMTYRVFRERITYCSHFPSVVQCAGHLYGDAAEMIVEELLSEGRLPMNTVIITVTERLNTALVAQEMPEIQPKLVQKKFEQLVATHFIKRCSEPVKDSKGRVIALQAPLDERLFVIPPDAAEVLSGSVRVKCEPGTEEEPPSKKRRMDPSTSQADKSDNGVVYWEINFPRFLQHFRDQAIVSAVASRMDSKEAGDVVRTILRHCEKTTNADAAVTEPMGFHELFSQLPSELKITKPILSQWMRVLTDNMPDFISKTDDSGGGMYVINTVKAMESLCAAHIESVVSERFGSKALRIFRMLLKHMKHVEQTTLENKVLMPVKQTRDLLYDMFKEYFVHYTELSKTLDHAPSNTFYLFNVQLGQVARNVLNECYKNLKNLLLKRKYLMSDSQWLLEKQERLEAVLVSLGLPAALAQGEMDIGAMELDDEKKEQAEVILESITPAEQQELKNVKAWCNYLERCEMELVSSTLFVLETYVQMLFSPHPKPARTVFGDLR